MKDPKCSRRALLKGSAALLGAIAATPLLRVPTAEAAGKASKASLQYQDKPNGDKECSKCLNFIPGKSPTANGSCKVVAGVISPHGYCLAFAPKTA